MPKVIYTATKGLYQTSGTGFEINDVVLSPSSEDFTLTATATDSLQTTTVANVTIDGSDKMQIADGTAVGQEAIVVVAAGTTTPNLTIRNEADDADIKSAGGVSQGDVFVCVWNGSAWKLLS